MNTNYNLGNDLKKKIVLKEYQKKYQIFTNPIDSNCKAIHLCFDPRVHVYDHQEEI